MDNEQNGSAGTRVSRITIGRLHNLGNYEHVRYEISVDVGKSDEPGEVLIGLEKILDNLQARSGVAEYEVRNAREVLAKPEGELSDYEYRRRDEYAEKIEKYEAAMSKRQKARDALNALNGSVNYVDAKLSWEDDEY